MAEVATRQRTADPATPTGASPHAPEPDGIEAQPELLAGGPVETRPGTALADGRLDPHRQVIVLRALQRTHGNAHVQRLLRERLQQTNARIQREAACPAPPAPAPPLAPQQDPKFQAVKGKVAATAAKEKQHPPAAAKATEAQNAATGPPNEVASQGAAGQVDTMARQEPGAFDKKAFVAAVRQAIERITPKTQEDADDFKSSGKAGQVKDQVTGMVTSGKEGAQKAIKDKTTEPPSPTGAPKPVTPMKAETPGPEPGSVGAASAMPSPKPAAELSLAHGKCETDAMMTEAGVTEPQLKKSNEPEFTGALDAKKKSDVHAATAPQEVKKEEQAALGQAKAGATALAGPAVAGMHSGRAAALTQVGSAKGDTKSQDEAKRAEIATKFEGIYNTTKTEVSAILTGLDAKVNTAFESGEKAARAAFENHVETRMNAYKDKRYGGLDGPALWLVDKLTSMPPEVNVFYVEGRNLYLSQMDGVIDNVAGIVERELGRAKARIAQGKKQIADEVAKLPKSLQAIGREAQQGITGKFEQLEQEVDAKQQALVDDLAQKYVEARSAVDARIDEMKAANKGLLDYAKDAMGSVVETITKLKDMLLGVLAKASDVIDTIIADPIQFLSNLVGAIKMGLNQFVGNIGKHLKDGLMGWLLGELASAGITMPKSLDFKGILDLVLQIMGLTYNAIRSRAVKIVGEPVVKKIEQVAEVFKILITEGPAGLWKWIVDKVDNLVDTVLGGIKDLVITKVITAGITWLISLLNPASAFVKACKMIYDVIMFFVERGSQIMSLVNAILDSVGAIASGALGAAANFVEKSLAKALPVAISFLASLLGLGGLSDKIRKIIEQVQKPVGKAVDFVINGVVKAFKKVTGFIGGLFGKKDKDKPDERSLQQKEAAEKAAAAEAVKLLKAPEATTEKVQKQLPSIKTAHKLTAINLVKETDTKYHVTTLINRADSESVELSDAAVDSPLKVGDRFSVRGHTREDGRPIWRQAKVTAVGKPGESGMPADNSTKLLIKYQMETGAGTTAQYSFEAASSTAGYAKVEDIVADFASNAPLRYSKTIGGAEHKEFKPKNLEVSYDPAARTRTVKFDYGTGDPAAALMTFTLTQSLDDFLTTSASGKNLRVGPVAGRGVTQQAVTHVPKQGMESAHLIANWFGGSGYKESLNLISTTKDFNRQMLGVEREIENTFRAVGADAMDMDVQVEWGEFLDGQATTAAEQAATQQVLTNVGSTNAERVEAFLKEIKNKNPKRAKVCNKVIYTVTFMRDGAAVQPFNRAIGPDDWTLAGK